MIYPPPRNINEDFTQFIDLKKQRCNLFALGKGVLLTVKVRGNGCEFLQGQTFFICLVWPHISFIKA